MANQVKEDTESLRVRFWDLGPDKPPKQPVAPKLLAPDDPIAKLEYEEAAAVYVAELQSYRSQKSAYDKWMAEMGGPVEVEMWSVDARDAVQRAPGRFVKRLPKGMQPGHGHAENLRRKEEENAEFRRVAATDPIFGTPQGAAA